MPELTYMSWLKKIERALGWLAIPDLTLYLVVGQAAVFLAILMGVVQSDVFVLVPQWVLQGEPWRLVTFLLCPPPTSVLFIVFAWWMFYLMGTSLEKYWGTFRYNLFLLVGYLLTVGVGFFHPELPVTNTFLAGTVFLAFAHLNPDFELAIFFILPVRIKWLALLTWIGYGYALVRYGWPTRLAVLAATGNFLLFFSRDLVLTARMRGRRMKEQAETFARAGEPRHRCRVCGKTDLTHPELDFRYCSKCAGDECYCPEHIFQHEHVLSADADPKK